MGAIAAIAGAVSELVVLLCQWVLYIAPIAGEMGEALGRGSEGKAGLVETVPCCRVALLALIPTPHH